MLPRVSDILKILYPGSLDFVQDHHLEEGSRLHGIMERLVNDEIYGAEYGEVKDERVIAVWDWLKANDVIFHATEEQHSHVYGFTGRPDLLANWKGQDYCFDYKFAESISEQNRMQLMAYRYLTGRKCAFIHCNREGVVKIIKQKPDPHLWAVFLAGLSVWKFHQRNGVKQ